MSTDHGTSDFYERYAGTLTGESEARRSAMLPYIERSVPTGVSVLDVGAGSGRDLAAMLALGLDAFGVEPSDAMRSTALALHPPLRERLRAGMLPLLANPFEDRHPEGFDAIVCSAVLMHVDATSLAEALASMVRLLKRPGPTGDASPSPALLVSVPEMDDARLQGDRDGDGRLFHNHSPERLRALLDAHGMQLQLDARSDAVLASTGTVWHTLVFRRAA